MHDLTTESLECMNSTYKPASDKDRKHVLLILVYFVWLHLRNNRFPDLRKSKLMTTADGSFKLLEKINNNAYKIELAQFWG